MSGQANNPVLAVLQIKLQGGYRLILILFFLIGIFIGCLILVLIFVFIRFYQGQFFFTEAEFIVSLTVEEHDVHIPLSTPATVAAETGTVGGPDHGLTV